MNTACFSTAEKAMKRVTYVIPDLSYIQSRDFHPTKIITDLTFNVR